MTLGGLVVLPKGRPIGVLVDGVLRHPDAMGMDGVDNLNDMVARAVGRFTIREGRAPENVQPQRKKNILAVICW